MRTLSQLFTLLTCLAPVACFGQQTFLDREIYLLQFDGGGTALTLAERLQAAQIVDQLQRASADHGTEVDKNDQQAIEAIQKAGPAERAALWERGRYAYAFRNPKSAYIQQFGAVWDQEKRIIDAHDPVLGIDPARQLVVTEHMIPALHRAAVWAGTFYKVPGPDAGFDTMAREAVGGLPRVQMDIAQGLSHMVLLEPHLQTALAKAPKAHLEQVSTQSHQLNFGNKTGLDEQMQLLSTSAAGVVRFVVRESGPATSSGAGGLNESIFAMKMGNRALTNAARSMSPACNPTLGPSTLAQNNCIAPMPIPGLP